jgi:hypothetical protein
VTFSPCRDHLSVDPVLSMAAMKRYRISKGRMPAKPATRSYPGRACLPDGFERRLVVGRDLRKARLGEGRPAQRPFDRSFACMGIFLSLVVASRCVPAT